MKDHKETIKWGIIGVGDVTEIKSGPAYKKTDGFEIVSVMRRSADKVADYAKRHKIQKFTTNAEELIHDPEVDAVYIATPPDTHMYYALKVAEAGKPCCIEKPMSPSYAESLQINDAFSNKGLPLFIAYYRRSLPRFLQIRDWIQEGKIGKVRHVNWILTQPASNVDRGKISNWRTNELVAPGGYFEDLASHGLDLFTFYFGTIRRAYGISMNQQGLYKAKDAVTASWAHHNGILGNGTWNFGAHSSEDHVTVYGEKGEISFSIFEDNPIKLINENTATEERIAHPANVQLHHVQNMQRAFMQSGFEHPSTGATGLHTAWVMHQILSD